MTNPAASIAAAHGHLTNAIKDLFAGVHDGVSRLNPPAEPTYEQLLDLYRPYADRPQLARVEIGEAALAKLLKQALDEEREVDPRYSVWGALTSSGGGGLFDVPLVVPDGMDPDAWRLLDTDGQVIKEGAL